MRWQTWSRECKHQVLMIYGHVIGLEWITGCIDEEKTNATYILHRIVPDLRLELEENNMYNAHGCGLGLGAIEGLR